MNRTEGSTIFDENSHIRQSISDILLTPIGTRIMRRDYGSQLFELIDRPVNTALALQLSAAAVMALRKWEPRIEVTRFQVQFDPSNPTKITANLDGINRHSQTKLAFEHLTLR